MVRCGVDILGMPKTKAQKKEILDELKDKVARQKAMVFVDFTGLKVKDIFSLRKKLKAAGSELKVAKKTLMGIIFKDKGLDVDLKKLKGEIALAFGYEDEVASAKIIYQLSQQNQNLKILGGFLENKFIEAEKVIELAQLPSKEQLLAKLVGSMKSPVSNFVYALNYNIKGLVYLLNKIKTQ